MILVTRQLLAERAAETFANQHSHAFHDVAAWKAPMTKGEIHARLLDMDPPTPAKVRAIIGNDSWCRVVCNSCNKEKDRVVSVDVTAGEYSTHICEECVKKMTALFA